MAFYIKQTISVLYVITVLAFNASSLRHDEECLALLEFKQTIFHKFDVGGIHKFASWKKIPSNASDHDTFDSHCCSWDGVMCSKEGHVIGLDLSESSLRGPINSNTTIFNLVHLQILNLSMNNFLESQIPSKIAHLKNLRILDLSDSSFSGQIPDEISQLVQLSSLDLSLNSLKLRSPSFQYLLQNMTRLEELELSGVDVGYAVPHFLANLSSLRLISLGNCQLQGEFPTTVFHLPKLNFLSLRNNKRLVGSIPKFHNTTLVEYMNLHDTRFRGTISESIGKLNHLVFLDLAQCSFSGHIPSSLSNLTQLTELHLRENQFTGLVPSLESLSKLNVLELRENHFEEGRMLDWVSKMTNLKELYVDGTNISQEIPPSIANITNLSAATMSGNFIFGQIPSSFMNLTTLTILELSDNQLQGPISNAFSNFKSLVYLDLFGNTFNGSVCLDTFIGLNKLFYLDFSYNRISFVATNNYTDDTLPELQYLSLSSCNLKEFPAFLRNQKKLFHLYLSENKIEGLIPTWIWNNSRETLYTIDLSNNFITGFHQHSHYLPWVRLVYFDISSNHLQGRLPIPPRTTVVYDVSNNTLVGDIPSLICELKSLQYLDLSSNHMIGTLPPCLVNLSNSLLVLDLKRNNFHGPMMDDFKRGCLLKRIDLSENRFNGQVSKSLANCSNLEVISLGDNSFHGLFPFWLGNLVELQVLILRFNKFYGEINGTSSMGMGSQFLKLRILDLSNNNFSGQLPDTSFIKWNAMKSAYLGKSSTMGFSITFDSSIPNMDLTPVVYPYSMTLINKGVKIEYERILNIFVALDLSCNKFVGEMPQSLQELQGLESLNLSNNQLTGSILSSLGNLKNLESLDLSQNKISGEIPKELLQLGYLAIFNVSFNHLDGRIPQGKQFNTFDKSSYIGNPRLCGQPLSMDCESSMVPTPPPIRSHHESLFPSESIDWIIIFLGVGSGLIVGLLVGSILYARYGDWFVERFGLRKNKWVRPLSSRRRN